jgi:hypothetical protein
MSRFAQVDGNRFILRKERLNLLEELGVASIEER